MKKDLQWTPAAARGLAEGVKTGDFQNFLDAATPGGIEASEARRQAAFVASETMPIELRPLKEAWERVGFRFGERLEGRDAIFCRAMLPVGWRKSPTEHSMSSVLLDASGSKRGGVFFKAAFYDYKANAHLDPRYRITFVRSNPDRFEPDQLEEVVVADCAVPWTRSSKADLYKVVRSFGKAAGWKAQDVLRKQGLAWLEANYPDFESVEAYW